MNKRVLMTHNVQPDEHLWSYENQCTVETSGNDYQAPEAGATVLYSGKEKLIFFSDK